MAPADLKANKLTSAKILSAIGKKTLETRERAGGRAEGRPGQDS